MLSIDSLLFVCLGYVAILFALAFYVDRRARQGRLDWLAFTGRVYLVHLGVLHIVDLLRRGRLSGA